MTFDSAVRLLTHPQVSSLTLPKLLPHPSSGYLVPTSPFTHSSLIFYYAPLPAFSTSYFIPLSFSQPLYPISRPLGVQHQQLVFLCISLPTSYSSPTSHLSDSHTFLTLSHFISLSLSLSLCVSVSLYLNCLAFTIFISPSQTFLCRSFLLLFNKHIKEPLILS